MPCYSGLYSLVPVDHQHRPSSRPRRQDAWGFDIFISLPVISNTLAAPTASAKASTSPDQDQLHLWESWAQIHRSINFFPISLNLVAFPKWPLNSLFIVFLGTGFRMCIWKATTWFWFKINRWMFEVSHHEVLTYFILNKNFQSVNIGWRSYLSLTLTTNDGCVSLSLWLLHFLWVLWLPPPSQRSADL